MFPAEAVAGTLRKAPGNGAVLKMEQNVFIPKAVQKWLAMSLLECQTLVLKGLES